MATYPVGAFFLTRVGGATGWLIGAGQALAGDPSRWEHAGIVTSEQGDTVEAAPGGAFAGHLADYAGRPLLISDQPVQLWATGALAHLGDGARRAAEGNARRWVAEEALALIGTPYSALDYLALALLHLHLPSRWVRQRVEDSGHLICSALVDAVLRRAGIHLFDDDRLPGDVMPADLAAWADAHPTPLEATA